jgi:hypothetical protein
VKFFALLVAAAITLAGCSSSGGNGQPSTADVDTFGLDAAVQTIFPGAMHADAVARAKQWCALRERGTGLLQADNAALDDAFAKSGGNSEIFQAQAAFNLYAASLYCPDFRPAAAN